MLSYNCPKIPSPKKIKEGIANFLKIYPKYTNYYSKLYNSKNLVGYDDQNKLVFWPPCHTIKVFANTNEKSGLSSVEQQSFSQSFCDYFKQWFNDTSLKIEPVKDKQKADLKILINVEERFKLNCTGYVLGFGILTANKTDSQIVERGGCNCVFNIEPNGLLQVLTNTTQVYQPFFNEFSNSNIIDTLKIKRVMLHEFGHFLGFSHEHTRADRPYTFQKLLIEKACKDPKIASSFIFKGDYDDIKTQIFETDSSSSKSAYDFSSIMQYNLSSLKKYIICNVGKGKNCDGLFKDNNSLSAIDKSYFSIIYNKQEDCPATTPIPELTEKECKAKNNQFNNKVKENENLKTQISDCIHQLSELKNNWLIEVKKGVHEEEKAKYKKNISDIIEKSLKLELEKFTNDYLIAKLQNEIKAGKCDPVSTPEVVVSDPKNNCEFLVSTEEYISSFLSYVTNIINVIDNILATNKKEVKIGKLNKFLNYKFEYNTYELINSLIKNLNKLSLAYKLDKKQESLIEEVKFKILKISKNKTKGFSPTKPEDSFFSNLQVALNNENINKINKILSDRVTDLRSSLEVLNSLIPIIPELKIKYCPTTTPKITTTTPRPITTPQSTSTPRPVFISK
jgi:hypothetical protein